MTVEIVVCASCRHPDGEREKDGRTGGAAMADALRAALAAAPELADVRLSAWSCLMNCQRHCTAIVRAPGRMTYVLGGLAPDAAAAEGFVAYVREYRRSADGVVPYRQWPAAVKGKFVARVPPEPPASADGAAAVSDPASRA